MSNPDLSRLRGLLVEAHSITSALENEMHKAPPGAGYFADATKSGVAHAIEQIAVHAGDMTMFVGAGVSMEAELPSWSALVRRLLLSAVPAEAGDEASGVWADTVLREGTLAAAAVAESLYPDASMFRRALRDALYAGDPEGYVPGALAGQIAWLKERMGSRLALLTRQL